MKGKGPMMIVAIGAGKERDDDDMEYMMDEENMKKGGMMGYAAGGSLKMVDKNGSKVPFFAADGKGKMMRGGSVKKYAGGGSVKKYAEGGKASFTALDEEERPSRGGRSATVSFTALDEEGRPYRSGSRQGTSGSPRTTRFTALDKDGKPYRNAASALTDKEIDRLFESGKFRVGRGETPKRMSKVDGMRSGGRVSGSSMGGSIRGGGCEIKGKTKGRMV